MGVFNQPPWLRHWFCGLSVWTWNEDIITWGAGESRQNWWRRRCWHWWTGALSRSSKRYINGYVQYNARQGVPGLAGQRNWQKFLRLGWHIIRPRW